MFKLFDQLKNENVLLLGCGGGYDIFCGLPLYFSLNCNVHLANFTFTKKCLLNKFKTIGENCYQVMFDDRDDNNNNDIYFPEYELSRELSVPVYAFYDDGSMSQT